VTDSLGGSSESGKGSDDPFDIVLDEDFIRGATAKEASARTRELSARWAKEPPKPTAWRGDGPDPLAHRHAPAAQADDPWGGGAKPARRERRAWIGYVFVGVVVAGLLGFLLYPRHHPVTPVNLSPAGTARPWAGTGSPSPTAVSTNPDDEYFLDSPSLTWANNESGIVAPAAAAVGGFSAAEIASGYSALGRLLAAGNLDGAILDGGPLTDFTQLLDSREQLNSDLAKWIAHPAYRADPTEVVTRFNPATTRLLGHTVKVSGKMSASVAGNGMLTVTGDYTFVYAVGPADPDQGSATRSVVHRVYELELPSPGFADPQPGKVWLYRYASDVSNTACNTYNGYLNPDFGYSNGSRSGKTVDPYASTNLLDPSASPRSTASGSAECDTVSRL
jgi:hypothetical protein